MNNASISASPALAGAMMTSNQYPINLTANNNIRHYVQHNYHDMSAVTETENTTNMHQHHDTFPYKLYQMLDIITKENSDLTQIISWQPHGRAFVIHKPKAFVDEVLPRFFKQSKLTSFQRQLNLYGFERLTRGDDKGAYYHELFLRGRSFLLDRMQRTKVKGTGYKASSNPESEPNFYNMPFVYELPSSPSSSIPQYMQQSSIAVDIPRYLKSAPVVQKAPLKVVEDSNNYVSSSEDELSVTDNDWQSFADSFFESTPTRVSQLDIDECDVMLMNMSSERGFAAM